VTCRVVVGVVVVQQARMGSMKLTLIPLSSFFTLIAPTRPSADLTHTPQHPRGQQEIGCLYMQ
jgi:hypothetical protein